MIPTINSGSSSIGVPDPRLLARQADRQRLLKLLDAVLTKENLEQVDSTPQQITMLEHIRGTLVEASSPARSSQRNTAPKGLQNS